MSSWWKKFRRDVAVAVVAGVIVAGLAALSLWSKSSLSFDAN
jgi:hypothetical protein